MNTITVDDKQLAVNAMLRILRTIDPSGTHHGILDPRKALKLAETHPPDIAFLDIEMPEINGLSLARHLKEINALTNIIFVTAYPEYALDAYKLYVSDFLTKPVEEEDVRRALDNLRHPVQPVWNKRIRIQCFGNFEAFVDNKPMKFRYSKTKELFAYLIDRKGAAISSDALLAVLWEDRELSRSLRNQLRNSILDLTRALKEAGEENLLMKVQRSFYLDTSRLDCDYYRFLDCDPYAVNSYHGEYMMQYSWAEMTIGKLEQMKNGEN